MERPKGVPPALAPALLAAALAAAAAPAARAAEAPRHLVLVSVDGLMPGYYLQADSLGLRIPNLRRLIRDGAHARGVVGVLPTVTYPSHTTLITGVPPRVHGVFFNTIFDPEERSAGSWYYYASAIRVPTLVSAARAWGLTTGAVSWPVSVGLGADLLIPEFYRPGSTHQIDRNLLAALSTPRLIEAVEHARGGRRFAYPWDERDRLDAADFILRTYRPHLLLLHLIDTDAAQHDHGPGSPEALRAVERADADLGRLLETLEKTGLRERTLFAVVSDHGFLPVATTLRPNTLLREAGLLSLDERGRVREWKAYFHASGGSAALHLKDGADRATLERVRALVAARAQDPASGIRDVLGPEATNALGGADSPLVLNAREGFYFHNAAAGEYAVASSSKGYHGYAPDRDELHAALLLSGPGLRRTGDLGVVRMTQVAPTLARFLGIALSPEADAALPLF